MHQMTLSDLTRRHFVHCVNRRGMSAAEVVAQIGLSASEICAVIAGRAIEQRSPVTYYRLARWLHMSLAQIAALANVQPALSDLVRLGMILQGRRPTSTHDQCLSAAEVGIGVATFRRALHGYETFKPSMQTCDKLTRWLAWTGFTSEEIASSAEMFVGRNTRGRRITVAQVDEPMIAAYSCACGRPGCVVPAHLPSGPRRKWRNDACRMWASRNGRVHIPGTRSEAPYPTRHARFIMINERPVPVTF